MIRRNSSTGTPNSALIIQTQMDVLNALINMIHKPRVTRYAQEALLVALNICDKRIDRFIIQHTKMIEQIVDDLCKRFRLALESANEALDVPISLYNGSSGSSSINSNNRSPAQNIPATHTSTERRGSTGNRNSQSIAGNSTPTTNSNAGPGGGNSILSPLHKLSSFRLGSGTSQSFNSPTTTAAAAFAYAKGALYGSSNYTVNNINNNMAETKQVAQHRVALVEERISPMQVINKFCKLR